MKTLALSLLLCWLLAGANSAFAGSIPGYDATSGADPSVIIGGGHGSIPITGTTFTFQVNAQGQGQTATLLNASGQNWNTLMFVTDFPGGPLSNYVCGAAGFFENCTFTVSSNQQNITIFFSGVNGTTYPGIRNGADFNVNLNSAVGGGWVPNAVFYATANSPEPATFTLLISGLGALLLRRRSTRS
jgi:hypothetical protein